MKIQNIIKRVVYFTAGFMTVWFVNEMHDPYSKAKALAYAKYCEDRTASDKRLINIMASLYVQNHENKWQAGAFQYVWKSANAGYEENGCPDG